MEQALYQIKIRITQINMLTIAAVIIPTMKFSMKNFGSSFIQGMEASKSKDFILEAAVTLPILRLKLNLKL